MLKCKVYRQYRSNLIDRDAVFVTSGSGADFRRRLHPSADFPAGCFEERLPRPAENISGHGETHWITLYTLGCQLMIGGIENDGQSSPVDVDVVLLNVSVKHELCISFLVICPLHTCVVSRIV